MVRFKLSDGLVFSPRLNSFNPTMVRFKQIRHSFDHVHVLMFQSHDGSIQTGVNLHVEFVRLVSIPRWFDSNLTVREMLFAELWKFQSHDGSIQTEKSLNGLTNVNAGFNPTMVRFKQLLNCLTRGALPDFNPTMVRFKPAKKTHHSKSRQWVSIPRWFDSN